MTSPITPQQLGSLFRPRSVALVGASDKSFFSQIAYQNLVDFGFVDRTFLVNRRGVETHGRATVTSCAQIGEPVDVAFMMVPQSATLDALSDAAAAGISNAVVLSSGYGEAGAGGRRAQAELVAHAGTLGMTLLGPNHLGFANFVDQIPVTNIPVQPHRPGQVALLSQSGASCSAMVGFATMTGVDLSYLVTLGNEAMITAGHVLDFLVEDEHTRAVAIFLEAIRDPQVFHAAARRAADAGKAVVVLKAGSSALSARTAAAHTGALVGDDATINAIFQDLGVIRVDSIEDMMITAGAAAHLGQLRRSGIGVVSISGGACDIIADRADDVGASLPTLAESTENRLSDVIPAYGTVQNPLDVTGAAIIDPTVFARSVEIMSADPSVGVVAMVASLPWVDDGEPIAAGVSYFKAAAAGIAKAAVPVVYVNQVVQPITDYSRRIMVEAGIPYVLPGLRQMIVALRNVGWWSDTIRPHVAESRLHNPSPMVPHRVDRYGAWSEYKARQLLASAGIPVVPGTLVTSSDTAVIAAKELGTPVAVKIVSPDILHKTDIGGVRLDVAGDDAVREAYDAVTAAAAARPGARPEGVLVSSMRSGGTELLVGVVRDPEWGLMLAVAIGGVFVEVLDDSALAPLPVTQAKARQMLNSLRGLPLLQGTRGQAPADLDAVAAVVARVSRLAETLGEDLESLEINPLRVDGDVVEALDALVTWRDLPDASARNEATPQLSQRNSS